MKDPAFLFYSSDFLSGVQDLTMEERGQYITLLCLQHQKGHLTEKMIRLSCGNAAADVMAKFRHDEDGNFYNERLEEEIEKRKVHTEKQRQRAIDGWEKRKNKTSSHATADATALPLGNENENVNIISSSLKERKEVTGEKETKEEVSWRTDYKIYMEELRAAWRDLTNNPEWMAEKEKFNPGVDILLSLEKSCKEFWATEAGWKHKKKSRTKEIDWKSTFNNMLSIKSNRVYVRTNQTNGLHSGRNDAANARRELEALKDLSEAVLQNIAGNRN
jgi:uncharacterized protein YdaU (DUF1376 family)